VTVERQMKEEECTENRFPTTSSPIINPMTQRQYLSQTKDMETEDVPQLRKSFTSVSLPTLRYDPPAVHTTPCGGQNGFR
jgi:hypothetical protein